MAESPIFQYRELDIEAVKQRLIEQRPAHKAQLEALERAGRKPTWKELNDFVVTI